MICPVALAFAVCYSLYFLPLCVNFVGCGAQEVLVRFFSLPHADMVGWVSTHNLVVIGSKKALLKDYRPADEAVAEMFDKVCTV